MRILALAILAVAAVSAMATAPARAQAYNPKYPVCLKAIVNFGGERIDCTYISMEQCAQTAAGLAAECIVNPFYAGGPGRDRRYRSGY